MGRSWIVRMRCTISKEVICDNCTKEQAESDPFEHAVDEMEVEQVDYEVLSITENK